MAIQATAILAVLLVVAWFIVGHPATDLANELWTSSPAPWENVIGFYYPDKDSKQGVKTQDSGTLAQCRDWANTTIASSLDPSGTDSTYFCGIGCSDVHSLSTCRAEVQ